MRQLQTRAGQASDAAATGSNRSMKMWALAKSTEHAVGATAKVLKLTSRSISGCVG
jgi:hypothetical protein